MEQVKVAILGASGYTGAELIRLLINHPHVMITALSADRKAGQSLGAVFPHLAHLPLPTLSTIDQINWSEVDVVFCALPHGTTQEIVAKLPTSIKVIDLSADFRLHDVEVYAQWYGEAHHAPELQKQAQYGLVEARRAQIRNNRLIAVPGCYPTSCQLPLIPVIKSGLISLEDIIIDAKSGVSGAGRAAKEANLHTEVSEGFHAYGVGSHRHMPEIEQGLSEAAGKEVRISFTPHLVPMNRGILATIYVKLASNKTLEDVRQCLAEAYRDEPFISVLAAGEIPHTRHVRGSNRCHMAVMPDRLPGRVILLSVIDNLIKGASGQAIQCLNLIQGWPETCGLEQAALFP